MPRKSRPRRAPIIVSVTRPGTSAASAAGLASPSTALATCIKSGTKRLKVSEGASTAPSDGRRSPSARSFLPPPGFGCAGEAGARTGQKSLVQMRGRSILHGMRAIFVCADAALARVVPRAVFGEPVLHVVESAAARRAIARRGVAAIGGDLERESVYQRAALTAQDSVVVAVGADRAPRVLAAIHRIAPAAAVVLLPDPLDPAHHVSDVTAVEPAAFVERVLTPAVERAALRARVERVRRHFASAERVLIMMQDDPDPDAIASALALKTLLGRSKAQAPIATFGTITRPENRAMLRVLEIDVEQIKPRAVSEYDMVAMVDTQPSFFEEPFDQVDLVIDHHPEEVPARARLKDIRPTYGATST